MKKKVVVVERDSDIRQLISYLLEDAGYLVVNSVSENDLVSSIKKVKPDAIILDVLNPHLDAELCKAIKASEDVKHIPLIVLSTHSKIDVMKEICADDVIPKPFDIHVFIAVLERQLVA